MDSQRGLQRHQALALLVFLLLVASLLVSPWPIVAGHPVVSTVAILFFGVPCAGAVWMMYVAIRNEAAPLLYVGLAILRYSFIWYGFRTCKYRRRVTAVQ